MKTFIIIFSLFILSPAFGQNGGYVKAQKKSDIDLVKAFGKSLETAPSSINMNKNQIRTEAYKHKISRLHEIWSGEIKAKDRIAAYLRSGNKENLNLDIIYNAQKYLSNFLIEAFDSNNTVWVRDIAELYMIPLNYLTTSKSITMVNPLIIDNGPIREIVNSDEEFKLWVKPESKIIKSENTISSSQFLYAVSVIIHYAIKNNLENDPVFSKFISSYFPIAMKHHYLRWIFNKGLPKRNWGLIGSFGPRGWKCNPGMFSHDEHVENLKEKRYGKDMIFKKIQKDAELNPYDYCNSYQDRDGWVALGVAHLMAAHNLRPSLLHIDSGTYDDLHNYLQASINLFNSRSGYNGKNRTMVFDLGGFYGFSHYDYSGYYKNEYPGWIGSKDDKDKIIKTTFEMPTKQKKSSWDMSHARRFVNFYWSFEKVINELNLDFTQENNLTLEESRFAYANNLFLNTVKNDKNGVFFTNFICGNNGWYRVNYLDVSGAGDAPATSNQPSLGKSALTGGQAYFIKYHPELNSSLKEMYDKHLLTKPATTESHLQIITEDLNGTASMPIF